MTAHRTNTRRPAAAGYGSPTRFGSFGAYAQAAAAGQVDDGTRSLVVAQMVAAAGRRRLEAADLVDQVTGDVPGLLPEAWISDLVDLMGQVSPTVTAFSSRALPDAGMVVNQPVVRQGPDVDVQTAENRHRDAQGPDRPGPVPGAHLRGRPGREPADHHADRTGLSDRADAPVRP